MLIILTGPESSGKTSLARGIAEHLGLPLVEEQARAYLAQRGGAYDYADLRHIAEMQKRSELRALAASESVVLDTDLLTIQIWSEMRFGRCDPWIERQVLGAFSAPPGQLSESMPPGALHREGAAGAGGILDSGALSAALRLDAEAFSAPSGAPREAQTQDDASRFYLLAFPDLPWEADPLREHPHGRAEIYERHRQHLDRLGASYRVIRGIGDQRLRLALAVLRPVVPWQ